jgi:hypothetical protein
VKTASQNANEYLMPDTPLKMKMARAPSIDQWTPGIRPTWTVAQVKSALYIHQTGSFTESALLVEAMYADDELPTSLDRSVNLIAGAEFSLIPTEDSEGKPEQGSQLQVDVLAPIWETSFPEHELAKMLRWFIMLGVAVGTIDWDTKQTPWKPYLRTLHPEFLWWDEGTVDPQTGRFGVFRYNSRNGSNEIVTPGDGKWVLLSDGRESWMRCSLRALATTWLVKQYAWRDWQRYNERHGLPIVKAMVPAVAEASDKASFFAGVRAMNSETTALLPQFSDEDGPNFDLELLEAKDQSWDTFRSVIERCDRKIQVHFLGTNTNELIGTAGSRATSESGRNISAETAAERERRVSTDLRDQLVKPFSAFNVPGAELDLAPWPHYNTEGEEDTLKRAEGMKAFGEALSAIKAAGWDVANIEEEAERFGLKLEEREEPEIGPGQIGDGFPNPGNEPLGGGGSNDDAGDQKAAEAGENLAQLAATEEAVRVEDVGRRDGAVAGQRYLDGLADDLADRADALDRVDAEAMAAIVLSSTSPDDLRAKLSQAVDDADPVQMAHLFERAILLAELAGRFAAQEDL